MAFRLFDADNNNMISKDEFKRVVQTNEHIKLGQHFDFDCDLMKTFFGVDGTSKLSFVQFSQFMGSLQDEIRKQEFQKLAKDGRITAEQFSKLITSYLNDVKIKEKLEKNISKLSESNETISFAEFDAYNRVLRNMDAIATSLRTAGQKNQDGSITRLDFVNSAKKITGIGLSPLEVSIIFRLFSSNDENLLAKQDYEEFIKVAKEESSRRQNAYDLWLKDEVRDDLVTPISKWDKLSDKLYTFSLKTLYGGFAGAVGATVVYPIDLVKTRMQNQREGARLYNNSRDCFNKIIEKEGWKGLYRGLGPQLVGVTPEKAIKLVVNDLLRDTFGQTDSNDLNIALEVLAGCGAGASQVIFTNPIEIVKIRLQVAGEVALQTGEKQKGAWGICKELGVAGLYKGASACFLRDIPFSGLYFPLFGKFKKMLRKEGEANDNPWNILLAGSAAGAIAASSTTPIDVVKTRLQVQARKGQDTYANILDCFIKIGKQEGWKAFFKGVTPRTLRSSPQFGVTLLTYETLQRYFKPPKSQSGTSTLVGNVPVNQDEMKALNELYDQKLNTFKQLFGKK